MLPARAKGRCKQRSGRIISEQPLLTRRIPISSRRRGPALEPGHETQSCPFIWAPLGAHTGKSLPAMQETPVPPLGREYLPEKRMEPTAAFLPGESKNRPWGCQEVGTTEQLPLSLSLPFLSGK